MTSFEENNLKQIYGMMETEELIRIAFLDHEDYEPEAVKIATEELRKRGISKGPELTQTVNRILQERKDKDEKVAMKPLSKEAKVLFLVLPEIGFYYMVFTPKAWKQRQKQALKSYMLGLGIRILLALIVLLFAYIHYCRG